MREDATWVAPPNDNTTYSNFVKSGSTAAAGLVPTPGTTAGTTKYLREDATWTEPNTEYTFIIDSDAKLSNWADNTAGNDYSRILIKENTNDKTRGWVLNSSLSGGSSSSPKIAIDISNGRTKSVVGESGSKIVINNSNLNTYLVGIKGKVTGTYPNFSNPGKEYFFRNVNIEVKCTSSSGGCGYGFSSCANLSNCTGTGTGCSSTSDGSGNGFYSCTNLSNCTGTGTGYDTGNGNGFYSCTNLSNCTGTGTGGNGFYSCTNLSNCTGTGTGGNGFSSCTNLSNCTGGGNGNGFSSCTNLSNCTGSGGSYGFYSCRTGFGNKGTFVSTNSGACYMEQSTGTTGWANNASGGWNLSA